MVINKFSFVDSQEIPASVGDWLSGLGLAHYEPSFVGNGYDDIDFLVSMLFVACLRPRTRYALR